jgi:hypothetical protein
MPNVDPKVIYEQSLADGDSLEVAISKIEGFAFPLHPHRDFVMRELQLDNATREQQSEWISNFDTMPVQVRSQIVHMVKTIGK